MNNTNKEKLFKLSTLAFCLAALPQAVHAAEEVQQVELKQVNVVGKTQPAYRKSKQLHRIRDALDYGIGAFSEGNSPIRQRHHQKTT